jgi:exopolysaccharide biosynthesis polyprenyl glycosylphosphotransferase
VAVDTTLRPGEPDASHGYELSLPHDRRGAAGEVGRDVDTPALRRDAVFRRALATGDVVALLAVVPIALGAGALHPSALLLVGLLLLTAKTMSLYDRDQVVMCKRTLDEAPGLFHLSTLVAFVFWLGHDVFADGRLSTGTALLSWCALIVALVLSRAAARRFAQSVTPTELCLVVAEADEHQRIAEKLAFDTRLKSRVIAHLPLVERRAESLDPPHAALERCVRALGVHRVVVAPDGVEPGVVLDVVSRAKMLGVNVSVLPRVCEVVGSSVEFDDLGGMTLLGVRPFRLSRSSQVIKRTVDLAGAVTGLLVGAPLLALVAVAIRLDSRGTVLFRQTRVGQDGNHFEMLKFRSMFVGAHAERDELAEHSTGRGLFKVADDPRITRVGRLLRRSSLDELPQLVNVLRGEMSLVGPRPERPEYVQLFADEVPGYVDRHRMRVGITGLAQVRGLRGKTSIEHRAATDNEYIANWSLLLDLKVLLLTVRAVLQPTE